MKHLRKAFSNHRLIRTPPEGSPEALSAQVAGDSASVSPDTATEHPPSWRRRKPAFPDEAVETVPEFITLWDETESQQAKSKN